MNKTKSGRIIEPKKLLVRNPEQVKPKTVVIQQTDASDHSSVFQKSKAKNHDLGGNKPKSDQVKFDSPELNSALRIARKIESVENIKPRKVKSVSELDKKKLMIINEKAAKQVNFPFNQPIYKDLIPLCVKTQPPSFPSVSREIPVQKDKEPVLSDFFTPKVLPEYSYHVPPQKSQKMLIREYDGFKLYRTIKNWNP